MPSQRPQRQSPKNTTASDSSSTGARRSSPIPRRSPRTPLQEIPAGNQKPGAVRGEGMQKKTTSRATEIEAKLSRAQEELRKIKEQLLSAEAAANDVQQELAETRKKMPALMTDEDQNSEGGHEEEPDPPPSEETQKAAAAAAVAEAELERCQSENERLKRQLAEAEARAAAAESRAEEAALRLSQSGEEVAEVKLKASQLQERLQSLEWARASLEAEMKKTKVQAEQWRKAAEEAAAVLAPAEENSGWPKATCITVDKPGAAGCETISLWSPLAAVEAEMVKAEKKAGGIRMLGDLWKKKANNHRA